MNRNEQLRAQADRNREISQTYAAEGNAEMAAFWEGQAEALEAEITDFPARQGLEGNAAGMFISGQISHRGGNFIKAFLTSFLKKEGNEAGCSSWSRIRPGRNLIKAALFFNQAAARLTMYVKTALHAACATRWIQSGRFMGISPRTVSNLNAGRAL